MRALVRLLPDCVVLVRRLLGDPRVGRRTRWLLIGLAAYVAMPFDLIPDFVPGLGQLDDVLVIGLVLGVVLRRTPDAILAQHWPGTPEGLALLRSRTPAIALALAVAVAAIAGAALLVVDTIT